MSVHSAQVTFGLLKANIPVGLCCQIQTCSPDAELVLGLERVAEEPVLPLANLSSEVDQEYFSDGMTDALIG